jgi:O-antigen/teichoic acid export membrane protein
MDEKAIRSAPWTMFGFAANKGISVLATVVLARLLAPADFGLLGMASIAILAITTITQMGLGHTVVLRESIEGRAGGTLLTLLIGLGISGSLIGVLVSPLVAKAFGEPRLQAVLMALSVQCVMIAPTAFYDALMRRELEFRRQFVCQTSQSVVYAVVSLGLAFSGAGVWSLVVGQAFGWATLLGTHLLLVTVRVRPSFDRQVALEDLRTGRGFLAQGFLWFLQTNLDYVAIGRFLGAAPLGLYTMAYRLQELPFMAVGDPASRVTFPSFTKMRREGQDIRPAFLSTTRLIALVSCPLAVLISATAEPFVETVLGPKWLGAVPVLMVLGIWGALTPVTGAVSWLLNSLGYQDQNAKRSALILLPTVPALLLTAAYGGITAVGWVISARALFIFGALLVYTPRLADIPLRDIWRMLQPLVFGCIAAWLVAYPVAQALEPVLPAALVLVTAGLAGASAYLLSLRLMEPSLLPVAVSQIRRTLGREPLPTP